MVSIIEPAAVEYVTKLHSANSTVHIIQEAELFKNNDTIMDQCISIQHSIAIIFSEVYRSVSGTLNTAKLSVIIYITTIVVTSIHRIALIYRACIPKNYKIFIS